MLLMEVASSSALWREVKTYSRRGYRGVIGEGGWEERPHTEPGWGYPDIYIFHFIFLQNFIIDWSFFFCAYR